MAIVHWEPAADFGALQRDINRVLSSFLDGGGGMRRAGQGWVPPIDLREAGDAYVLAADLPGVSAEDVAIDIERGVLTLSGARSRPEGDGSGGLLRAERGYGSFRRQLTLPDGVDPDEIAASFDRGVLEIRIPKPVQARPRRVSIDVGSAPRMIDEGRDDGDGDGEETAAGAAGAAA